MFADQPSAKVYSKLIPPTKLRELYLDELTADVHFAFENGTTTGERIPAHKLLLAIESDVFKAMFYGGSRETGDVKIVDVSADEFREFLQFFYGDQIKLTMKNINAVISLVKKYSVADSMNSWYCERFLSESLNSNNVCFIYDIAIRFDLFLLKNACKSHIQSNTSSVFGSKGFLKCSKLVLSQILELDGLSCAESQLFQACMNWIKKASGEDVLTKELLCHHFGDLFYEIRFGSMEIQEFIDLMPSYGNLFTPNESQEITQMIASSEFVSKVFKKGPCRSLSKTATTKSSKTSLAEQFESKLGVWSCKPCSTSNSADAMYCACFEKSKYDSVPKKDQTNNNLFAPIANAPKRNFGTLGTTSHGMSFTKKKGQQITRMNASSESVPKALRKASHRSLSRTATNKSAKLNLAEQLKRKPGGWSCRVCYASNSADAMYCEGCEKLILSSKHGGYTLGTQSHVPIAATASPSITASIMSSGSLTNVSFGSPSFSFSFGSQQNVTKPSSFGLNPNEAGVPKLSKTKELGFVFQLRMPESSSFAASAATLPNSTVGSSTSSTFGGNNQSQPRFSFGNIGQSTSSSLLASVATPETPSATVTTANTSAGSVREPDEEDNLNFKPTAHFEPVIELPALVEVKTGEENETTLF